MNCVFCHKTLSDDLNVCKYCSHYQNIKPLRVGDKIIYDPDIRTITYIWDPYELYSFYPGMQFTIKEIKKNKENVDLIVVEEVAGDFAPIEFRSIEMTSKVQQNKIIENFIKIWQSKKPPIFKFRRGQKVLYKPSNLTRCWIKDGLFQINLKECSNYRIENIIDRKYLVLDNNKIYWKDVQKL